MKKIEGGKVIPTAPTQVARVALPFLLLAVLVLPASAGAVWTSPVTLSDPADAVDPQVGVDADGDAVFVWQFGGNPDIQARARSAAGTLSTVQTLSEFAVRPQVAVDADGDAVFVWHRFFGLVEARARSATGTLRPVQTLAGDASRAADLPQVAVDADGDAVFVWQRLDGSAPDCCPVIEARARSATGTLSPVQTLSAPGKHAELPQVAVDADGDAVFVWRRFDGSSPFCCFRVQTRARSVTGTLSPVKTLSGPGRSAQALGAPQVAIDADGDAVLIWHREDGYLMSRARSATGSFSPVQTLARSLVLAQPQVAVDTDGDAVFTWRHFVNPGDRIRARARSATGTLSPVQVLSAASQHALDPQVAVDADGDAVFVWRRFDGTSPNPPCCTRVQARVRSATGTLGPVQTLSAGGRAEGPQVAVDAVGDAVAVWRRYDGANFRIETASGP